MKTNELEAEILRRVKFSRSPDLLRAIEVENAHHRAAVNVHLRQLLLAAKPRSFLGLFSRQGSSEIAQPAWDKLLKDATEFMRNKAAIFRAVDFPALSPQMQARRVVANYESSSSLVTFVPMASVLDPDAELRCLCKKGDLATLIPPPPTASPGRKKRKAGGASKSAKSTKGEWTRRVLQCWSQRNVSFQGMQNAITIEPTLADSCLFRVCAEDSDFSASYFSLIPPAILNHMRSKGANPCTMLCLPPSSNGTSKYSAEIRDFYNFAAKDRAIDRLCQNLAGLSKLEPQRQLAFLELVSVWHRKVKQSTKITEHVTIASAQTQVDKIDEIICGLSGNKEEAAEAMRALEKLKKKPSKQIQIMQSKDAELERRFDAAMFAVSQLTEGYTACNLGVAGLVKILVSLISAAPQQQPREKLALSSDLSLAVTSEELLDRHGIDNVGFCEKGQPVGKRSRMSL